jgi:hypothetical protein
LPPLGLHPGRSPTSSCSSRLLQRKGAVRGDTGSTGRGAARHAAQKPLCDTRGAKPPTWRSRSPRPLYIRPRHSCIRSGARVFAPSANKRSCICSRRKQALVYLLRRSIICSRRSNLTKLWLERSRGAKLLFCSFCRFRLTVFQ